jgi:hypothetical protein
MLLGIEPGAYQLSSTDLRALVIGETVAGRVNEGVKARVGRVQDLKTYMLLHLGDYYVGAPSSDLI